MNTKTTQPMNMRDFLSNKFNHTATNDRSLVDQLRNPTPLSDEELHCKEWEESVLQFADDPLLVIWLHTLLGSGIIKNSQLVRPCYDEVFDGDGINNGDHIAYINEKMLTFVADEEFDEAREFIEDIKEHFNQSFLEQKLKGFELSDWESAVFKFLHMSNSNQCLGSHIRAVVKLPQFGMINLAEEDIIKNSVCANFPVSQLREQQVEVEAEVKPVFFYNNVKKQVKKSITAWFKDKDGILYRYTVKGNDALVNVMLANWTEYKPIRAVSGHENHNGHWYYRLGELDY
jgi:hypothetical protein